MQYNRGHWYFRPLRYWGSFRQRQEQPLPLKRDAIAQRRGRNFGIRLCLSWGKKSFQNVGDFAPCYFPFSRSDHVASARLETCLSDIIVRGLVAFWTLPRTIQVSTQRRVGKGQREHGSRQASCSWARGRLRIIGSHIKSYTAMNPKISSLAREEGLRSILGVPQYRTMVPCTSNTLTGKASPLPRSNARFRTFRRSNDSR
jgi:hypothetical protein